MQTTGKPDISDVKNSGEDFGLESAHYVGLHNKINDQITKFIFVFT